MRNRLLLLLAGTLAFTAGPVSAELDFTLQHKALQADGIGVDKPYITDGPSKIFLQILGNWRVVDSPDGLDFTPTVSNAQVRLGRYRGPEVTVDEAGAHALQQQLAARVPKGATNVSMLPADINPLPLFGWSDVEVSVRYDFYGQSIRQSLMYVHMLPGRLVELSVTAPEADFSKLSHPARAVLSSWFEPSRDLPPDLARMYEEEGSPK